MLSANRIEEVIKNCQALIQQKSYSGQEGEVVNAIKTMMQHYQFVWGGDRFCTVRNLGENAGKADG